MQRPITVKSSLALAAAALTVGVVAALSMPAVAADTQPQAATHRSTRAVQVPDMILDSTGTANPGSVSQGVGHAFGSRAVMKDVDGKTLGTAYANCGKDATGTTTDEVLCTSIFKFTDGAQIALDAVIPIPHSGAAPKEFDGIVTGGTLKYEGLTGSAHFTPSSVGVYEVTFS
ncbi:hypothetical protein ACFVXG_23385 [Kitasatospora sp. NPDC058162]|uniref:hypothetical protein n=1 Tax=Kitasatospora sp. NPDC058162 TaxID=3346362 RepID=UPI0036DE4F91